MIPQAKFSPSETTYVLYNENDLGRQGDMTHIHFLKKFFLKNLFNFFSYSKKHHFYRDK